MYGELGIRTLGSRMVGADETTELWRPPRFLSIPRLEVCRQDFIEPDRLKFHGKFCSANCMLHEVNVNVSDRKKEIYEG